MGSPKGDRMSGQCDCCSSNPCVCLVEETGDCSSGICPIGYCLEKIGTTGKLEQQLEQSQKREQKLKEALESMAEATVSRRWMMDESRAILNKLYGCER